LGRPFIIVDVAAPWSYVLAEVEILCVRYALE
jgi:hypothetical protein